MPPRRSKAKPSGDSAAAAVIVEQAPVRRSARTRRAVAQEDYESERDEPPRKRGRSETSERSSPASIKVGEGNSTKPLEDLQNEEYKESAAKQKALDTPKTPAVKPSGRGRGRKASEHKDTPHPLKCKVLSFRGRKRETLGEELVLSDGETQNNAAKRSKFDRLQNSDKSREPVVSDSELIQATMESSGLNAATPSLDVKPSVAEGEDGIALKEGQFEPAVHTKSPPSATDRGDDSKCNPEEHESSSASYVTNGESSSRRAQVKQPTGNYEGNIKIGNTKKDLTVATLVVNDKGSEVENGHSETTKASLEKLGSPDIVAMQKSTPAAAKVAETCGFEVFGGGPTRLLVSASARARIEVKEPAETRPLITLAFDELNEVISSASNRKRVEDYLTAFCEPADEFSAWTLSVDGKTVTLVNVQLESRNNAVTSLLIGCLMQKLDSRPNAFVLTGYMPHVRPDTPAYELLRDGYFENHSIESLQRMRDIKMDDDDEESKRGLIDFFWKAYQHSRSTMRSVYETVMDGESVVSITGQAVIWHSTDGVEAVRVFNHAKIVKADLAITSEA